MVPYQYTLKKEKGYEPAEQNRQRTSGISAVRLVLRRENLFILQMRGLLPVLRGLSFKKR